MPHRARENISMANYYDKLETRHHVAPGEVGEVVVTSLFNTAYPMIRFGTGDLSAVLPGASPCGRTNTRIRGWMGRADQTTKVKGMFVHPSQVAEVVKRHKEILKARLIVDNPRGDDRMTLRCEVHGAPPAGLHSNVPARGGLRREAPSGRGDVPRRPRAGQIARRYFPAETRAARQFPRAHTRNVSRPRARSGYHRFTVGSPVRDGRWLSH